ncbi:MAG: hypothetical protein ACRC5A_07470 [Enterobacteriaceae bacterium]
MTKSLVACACLSLFLFSINTFAYVAYNDTNNSLEFDDSAKPFVGMDVSIPAHQSATCNPWSNGCAGEIDPVAITDDICPGTKFRSRFVLGSININPKDPTGYYITMSSTSNPRVLHYAWYRDGKGLLSQGDAPLDCDSD